MKSKLHIPGIGREEDVERQEHEVEVFPVDDENSEVANEILRKALDELAAVFLFEDEGK